MEEEERAQIIREYMQGISQQRRQETKRCQQCGELTIGLRTRRYCGAKCRLIARRARVRASSLEDNPRRFTR